jgi:hypothetical protein
VTNRDRFLVEDLNLDGNCMFSAIGRAFIVSPKEVNKIVID